MASDFLVVAHALVVERAVPVLHEHLRAIADVGVVAVGSEELVVEPREEHEGGREDDGAHHVDHLALVSATPHEAAQERGMGGLGGVEIFVVGLGMARLGALHVEGILPAPPNERQSRRQSGDEEEVARPGVVHEEGHDVGREEEEHEQR